MAADLSIVIPAHNAGSHLKACLEAVARLAAPPREVIVVDDASTDGSVESAVAHGATILRTQSRCGPAAARNLGAERAKGEILFFVDSDVRVHADATARIAAALSDPAVDAVIGSYDDTPACQDFLSQYKNLMHCFVHQTANREAATFWGGCGAIRRDVFLALGGFDPSFARPAIEDIELGYRLRKAGRRILLDPLLRGQHLKKWAFTNLVKTDVLDRGVPWTELILRDKHLPNDLNVQIGQRASIALVYSMLALAAAITLRQGGRLLVPMAAILFSLLSEYWGDRTQTRSHTAGAAMLGSAAALVLLAWLFRMRALVLLVAGSVAELLLSRLFRRDRWQSGHRWLQWFFILGVLLVSAKYLAPAGWLALGMAACACLIALLNGRFYQFLARKRGASFAAAAFPFHLLYHFYNGVSFLLGASRWFFRTRSAARPSSLPG